MSRRVHSSLDNLPAPIREALTRMVVDNAWPDDFEGEKNGTPRYEDMVKYCAQKKFLISLSAIGRWAMQLRTISRMKAAGMLARDTMAGLTAEDAPKTQKAAAEMMTAVTLEFMANHENFESKQIREVAQAIRDCAQVSVKADQYIREQQKTKADEAIKKINATGKKNKIDPEVLKQIREEIYGIVSSK